MTGDVRVVDASAVAAVAFVEPEAASVKSRVAGTDLLAPPLLPLELTNIAWKKCRRNPDLADTIEEQLVGALLVPVTLVRIDHRETLQLALLWGLSAYDASYLWVAWRHDSPLVTLDRRLAAVAEEMGLS